MPVISRGDCLFVDVVCVCVFVVCSFALCESTHPVGVALGALLGPCPDDSVAVWRWPGGWRQVGDYYERCSVSNPPPRRRQV
jgi:hypothetical protein